VTREDPVVLRETLSPDRLEAELQVPGDLRWFQGHFPGQPVLPGVVQLGWAIRHAAALAGQCAGPGAVVTGIRQLKFKAVITPDTVLTLEVFRDGAAGGLRFCFRSAAGEHSSGLLLHRAG
jgi:3-hydroxymyristoyl/3-hydroxydecanoyl-(acyl carrier protein) dehydratase